ncbi:hypothetical protein [Providencia rettgeri]|uniref:hypothetical protein n=1 Tax=Providencia rettgeri TaxID=587 RepID=UPI002551FB90|nr:hypothetical protein [Providencia rettgeri]MDK7744805.1 hypothetical protein [Providencia rettgeri]MDK7759735.1 hypothetical protein [Providencia rettgeri]MDT2035575.1 hypothetical protein [Providencia rettgeri]
MKDKENFYFTWVSLDRDIHRIISESQQPCGLRGIEKLKWAEKLLEEISVTYFRQNKNSRDMSRK